jgi:hypothetical protein
MSSTTPLSPSTRTRAPSANMVVASRVPDGQPGMPYSRATIAACELTAAVGDDSAEKRQATLNAGPWCV